MLRTLYNVPRVGFMRCRRSAPVSAYMKRALSHSLPAKNAFEDEKEQQPVQPSSNYVIHTEEELQTIPEYAEGLPTGQVVHGEETIKYSELGVDEDGLQARLMSLSEYFFGNLHHSHHVFYNTINTLSKQGKKTENRTFIDLKVIRAKSGRGGNGCVSFFRDANRPVGPPDGGDGGDGGDVFISVVSRNMSSLHKIRRTYEAKSGTPGKGSQLDGAVGEDVIIEVPVGTTIRWIPDPMVLKKYLYRREGQALDDIKLELRCDDKNNIQLERPGYAPGEGWVYKENDEEYYRSRSFFNELNERVTEHDHELVAEEFGQDKFPLVGIDFDRPTKRPIPLLRGGRGGMGNMHFLTKDIRNPRFSKRGREGLTSYFLLELKLIADLGLVGLPNAGKSTLLRAISKARPRVGHWEFTTLQPTAGTIFTSIDKDPFTVADIPGIIKGASQNKGMGLDFLRHIERSGGLVFVVSLENPDVVGDLQTLVDEVGPKRMRDKKVLVVATKADLSPTGDAYARLREVVDTKGWKIVPVCAEKGQNVERCIRLMGEIAYSKS